MGRSHEIGLRDQFVSGMAPVSVVEGAQLTAVYKGFEALLDALEVGGSSPGALDTLSDRAEVL